MSNENIDNEIITKLDDFQKKNENLIKDYEKSIEANKEDLNLLKSEVIERLGKVETAVATKSNANGIKKGIFETEEAREFMKGFSFGGEKAKEYFYREFPSKYNKDALGFQSNNWQSAGVLCPPEFSDTLLDLVFNDPSNANLLNRISWDRINSKSVIIPVYTRPMTAVWENEAEAAIFSKAEFGKIEIFLRKLSAGYRITYEQQNFSRIDVQQIAMQGMANSMRERIVWDLFYGGDKSGISGILKNNDILNIDSSVSKAFSYDDLFDMDSSLMWGANRVYIMHRKTFGWLRKQKDTIGQYYNAIDVTNMAIPRINGIPVILVSDVWVDDFLITGKPYLNHNTPQGTVQSTDAILTSLLTPADLTKGQTPFVAGDTPILLADLGVAFKGISNEDVRMSVNPYTYDLTDQTQVILRNELGGKLVNPKAIVKLTIKA